ncbi:hypothetical protein [Flavobacterium wongokense]|uniref:hypothetical protein n=1 Tax=Flavobacterium wongokense TaxID=2910674 RepID=UPI001F1FE4D5|nr:hypothetical protein [Flavobacterium sp. WG47]MCF6132644.1 hypothetical protein [Flavobacterium sp. WG47]
MKKFKLLLLLLTVSAAIFYSCSDSNPVENEAIASKSISLRTTLNAIKKVNGISGKNTLTTQDQAFCFAFVYPITLEYNNGTQVTVANFEGLLEILANENTALYIEGIAFPFQVQQEGAVTTIHDEAEFFAILQACDNIQVVNDFVFDFTCYSIEFPISVLDVNQVSITVHNQAELMQLVSSPAGTYQLDIVFPINVIQNNQTIVIHDLYEFFELNNDCSASNCLCDLVYQPVCVQTPAGIVEYSNECFAACDGYDQNDFVSCDPNNPCPCPANFEPVCVQTSAGVVQYDNACRAECDGFTAADFIECGVAPLPTFGELLSHCFVVHYPAQVQFQGALVTVHNDGELLQYWFPAQSAYPAFNYPITITFTNGITTTVLGQSDFQILVAQNCN